MFKFADAHSDYPMCLLIIVTPDSQKQAGAVYQVMAIWPLIGKDHYHIALEQLKLISGQRHILLLEGGEALGGNVGRLENFSALGVRYFGLTWNLENALGYGCMVSDKGLKPFGAECIMKANELEIPVDLSHAGGKTFWDALQYIKLPPMASHSNCKAVYNHPRNLSDDQIRAIVEREGFIGINFFSDFLSKKEARVEDIIRHILHVCELGGEDHVGFGSDFCGIERSPVDGSNGYALIAGKLVKELGASVAQKICYGNFERYILK